MKTKAISSFSVLFALVAGIGALAPAAAADHPEVTIVPAAGSSVPVCEETEDDVIFQVLRQSMLAEL